MNNNNQKPQAGEESAETRLLCDGVESAVCPCCLGRKWVRAFDDDPLVTCFRCGGTGRVPKIQAKSHNAPGAAAAAQISPDTQHGQS